MVFATNSTQDSNLELHEPLLKRALKWYFRLTALATLCIQSSRLYVDIFRRVRLGLAIEISLKEAFDIVEDATYKLLSDSLVDFFVR